MTSLNGILETGKRSLLANREYIGIIGHNIANVNTPGYTRQRGILRAARPMDQFQYGNIGTGVEMNSIVRARDQLLDKQYRSESSSLGRWERSDFALMEIQSVFTEPGDNGLSSVIEDFWNAWSDLANDPESPFARSVVRERAQVLTGMLNRYDSNLRLIEEKLNDEFVANVGDLNQLAVEIAGLNDAIRRAEAAGQNANDLRDQRDLKLDQMSRLTSIQYIEEDDGSVNVYLNGDIFVQGGDARELTTRASSRHDVVVDELVWRDTMREVALTGGELKGIVDARDVEIETVRERLDELALGLAQSVNSLHRSGYGLNGSTGLNFFNANTTGAGDIALSDEVQGDLNTIAAGGTSAAGDNTNALSIAALADQRTMNGGRETFSDYFSSTVAGIGTRSQTAEANFEKSLAVANQVLNLRDSVHGVIMDEELTELIKFQQSYGAATVIVDTVNDMMSAVINLGR